MNAITHATGPKSWTYKSSLTPFSPAHLQKGVWLCLDSGRYFSPELGFLGFVPPHRQTLRQELECKFILNVMGVGAGRETGRLPGKAGEDSDCCGDLEPKPSGKSGRISYVGWGYWSIYWDTPPFIGWGLLPLPASIFLGKGMLVRVTGRGRASATRDFKEGKPWSLCPPYGVWDSERNTAISECFSSLKPGSLHGQSRSSSGRKLVCDMQLICVLTLPQKVQRNREERPAMEKVCMVRKGSS